MKSLLFIHRSVGRNLITDGDLRTQLHHYYNFSDYDQNYDTLTLSDKSQKQCEFNFPEDDTKPKSYAKIFSINANEEEAAIRDFILKHDIIAIKSCYANSNIKSAKELEDTKQSYKSIANFFNNHSNKRLIILTSPPLSPIMTNAKNAERARSLSNWLASTDLSKNVSVFNFFDLLADSDSNRLKREYRRLMPFDSHPNSRASAEVASLFVNFITSNPS